MMERLPALFIGHGSPMNAIEPGPFPNAWRSLAQRVARPRAILCISAHWYTRGTAVTVMTQPATIHDFHGFPPALFACEYPAPGDPLLAQQVRELLGQAIVAADQQWGLDHGAWSVLLHMYPEADIPVVQLSLNGALTQQQHYDLAKQLRPLRDAGVLILGSGNVVHNLQRMVRSPAAAGFDWAADFEARVRAAISAGDIQSLIDYDTLGNGARLAVPTDEHYLPLLYVLAQQQAGEALSVPVAGIEYGSISMLCAQVGADQPKQ